MESLSSFLPKRGLIVVRGNDLDMGFGQDLSNKTHMTVVLLPPDADIDVLDLETMKRLGWMPIKEAKMPKAVSKKQARLLGAVAGGRKTKAKGLTQKEAKTRLRGVKVAKLPAKAPARKGSKKR